MKTFFLHIIFVFFFIYFSVYSQNKSIIIKILPVNKENKILKNIFTTEKINDSTKYENYLNEKLLNLYDKGYIASSFDSIVKSNDTIYAYLFLGKKYEWANLSINNNLLSIVERKVFKKNDFNGTVFNYKEISKILNFILTYFENNGYPFATIWLDSLNFENNKISAAIKVKKNELITIDSIIVKGNAKISHKYLYNYLNIFPGDIYNEKNILNIDERLKELLFIYMHKQSKVEFSKGKADIYLFLNKKNTSNINGILGILPNQINNKVDIIGDLRLKLSNPFGYGESIEIKANKLQNNSQTFKGNFFYPYLFDTPFGIEPKLDIYKRDTLFIKVSREIGISYLFSGKNYLKAFYELTTSSLLSTKQYNSLNTLPQFADFKNNSYGLEFMYNKLDYFFNPRKGISIKGKFSAGIKRIVRNPALKEELYDNIQFKSNQFQLSLSITKFFRIKKLSTIMLRLSNGGIINSRLFENDLIRIGGINTIRGFDDESIWASSFVIGTAEYRFLLEQNSYLFLFTDYAYYEKKTDTFLSDTPLGFGGGISFETKLGIFSVSYALGKQLDNPVLISNGKIHFGYLSFF